MSPAPSGASAPAVACKPRIDVTGIEACVTAANIIGQLAAENEALRAELATRPTVAPEPDPLLADLLRALGWQGGTRGQALEAVRALRMSAVRP